ncbi:polyprenyl synthetase family protein [Streptomyces sp. NBC_01077]|uniref:polyprenyl synthetase family protein n=1 Tax=Streptomyces sp. NBC_01077 TaxID=2903746 RepID=UPI0038637E32|nr:polyprenyl synthetase family protein [Streptomyces sp. NBC_01077]WSV43796.1 polyprenyl synthetase family protein [Streptomyces sp. NBC_01077]
MNHALPADLAAPSWLEQGRALCVPPLKDAVARLASPMGRIASYHFGWTDQHGRLVGGHGGKAVRAALAVLSAEAAGAERTVGIPGGIAVELVHNFSLLHDDFMDRDTERRHRPAAWTVFGGTWAVLTGDALLALAPQVLCEQAPPSAAARAVKRLTAANCQMVDGQARDLAFEQRDHVDISECLQMEAEKTASLLGLSACIGAVLAAADDTVVGALERYGHHLGMAFQAVDDLLGIWGPAGTTGKTAWSDLRRRKKTLPVVAALAEGGGASRQLADQLAAPADRGTEPDSLLALRALLIEKAGGRAWTERQARWHHEAALNALDEAPIPQRTRRQLSEFSESLMGRVR